MAAPKRQFSRPSISLSDGVKKDWQEVEVRALSKGDNVRGWGTIEQIVWDDFGQDITIKWTNGKISLFAPQDKVTAFTAV